jgi:RNase P subunit RPR2
MRKRKEIPARVKLTDCVECKQPFAYPIMDESHEAENDMWFVVLRCGNCFYVRELLITQARAVMFTSRSRHDWNERAWDWCDAR